MATQTLENKAQKEATATATDRTRKGPAFLPPVDIQETQEELLLQTDLPGVKSGDIDISFEQGELTITGKVAERQPPTTAYLLHEYTTGDFVRKFQLGEVIDASRISAEHKDGVLTLHLPKVEAAKPRKIAVKAQ